MKKNSKAIQNKISNVKYNCAQVSHLIPDYKICEKCKEKTCLYICPADVYNLNETTGEIVVQYENCLECGACRIACPKKNINWNYPPSGCGVVYKNS